MEAFLEVGIHSEDGESGKVAFSGEWFASIHSGWKDV